LVVKSLRKVVAVTIQDDLKAGASVIFKAEISERDGSILVRLFGELDVSSAAPRRELFAQQIHPAGSEVQVDLLGLDFIDSAGIGLLVSACKRIRGSSGAFRVTCGDGPVRRVLEIEGLVDFLSVERSAR
jgi:anti-sigma B factor antagonist